MSIVQKITTGFVVQNFDIETGRCVGQEFVAGDQVEWEDNENNPGTPIDQPDDVEYFHYHMVQPK